MSRIDKNDVQEILPLLPGQETPFSELPESGASTDLEQRVWRLDGAVDPGLLERSFGHLAARHPTLRTVFFKARKQPVQIVRKSEASPPCPLAVRDLRHLAPEEAGGELERFLAADRRNPVDAFQGPLLRPTLLRASEASGWLVFTYHPLILDDPALSLLVADLSEVYGALAAGRTPPAAEHLGPKELVVWRKRQDPEEALDFWEFYLEDFGKPTPLPADHPPAGEPGEDAAEAPGTLEWYGTVGAGTVERLAERAREMGTEPGVLAQAAWAVLLARFGGGRDVVFGVDAPGRGIDLPGVERAVASLANRLPVRVEVDGGRPLEELIHALGQHRFNFDHSGHVSPAEIQAKSPIEPPLKLYGSVLAVHGEPWTAGDRSPAFHPVAGLASSPLRGADLAADLRPDGDGDGGWRLELRFRRDRFEPVTAEEVGSSWLRLLESVAERADGAISELEALTPERREWLRELLDRTLEARELRRLTPELLVATAGERPDAVALSCGDRFLSYAELHRRAGRFAHWLRRQGVGRESLVGVFGERGLGMAVTILGTLEAGAAWVPLDPSHPDDRLARILSDSRPAVVATQGRLAYRLWQLSQALESQPQGFCWDATPRGSDLPDARHLEAPPSPNPAPATAPEELAYVFYTSGSTGLPKGAMVHHRGMINHLWAKVDLLGLDDGCVVAQNASHGFDIFVWQLLAPLLVGGRAVICAGDDALDPARLLDRTEGEAVTVLEVVPSMLGALLDRVEERRAAGTPPRLPALEFLLSTGEALPVPLARRWFEAFPAVPVVNAFGPTECSDDTLHHLLSAPPAASAARVPVGSPVPGFAIYVLDRRLRLLPRGCPGQLVMAGVGVGRGYLGAPARTADTFVPDPLTGAAGGRLYLSGDRGRLAADGAVEFLGRLDSQVKVRGHRIEVGEVEAALWRHPAVREVAVVALAELESYHLAAFFVADEELDTRELRTFAEGLLAPAMIPKQFVQLDALPLNQNGKVDRSALRREVLPGVPVLAERRELVPPEGEIEVAIAEIWQELLEIPEISRTDNFFQLGGHSLLAVQVRSRLNHRLGLDLELRVLLEKPRLDELAEAARSASDTGWVRADRKAKIPTLPVAEHYPLSHAQRLLWFLQQLDPEDTSFNLPEIHLFEGPLDPEALERALEEVVTAHAGLRTTFAVVDGEPVQRILPAVEAEFERSDLTHLLDYEQEVPIRELHHRVIHAVFDLEKGPLRARLVTLAPDRHLLILVVHHLVTDQMSFGVLMRDLVAAYRAIAAGERPHLTPPPVRYVDYAAWQNQRIRRGEMAEAERYWLRRLGGELPTLELPGRVKRPSPDAPKGTHTVSMPVEGAVTDRLRRLGAEHEATLFATLLAVANAFLARVTGQTDVLHGTPTANRGEPDVEGVVGFFVNMLPLRTDLSGDPTFTEILERTRRTTVEAFDRADYPFELLVQKLNPERELGRQPIFSTTFVVVEVAEESVTEVVDGLTLRPQQRHDEVTAAYDFNLMFYETEESLQCAIGYRADLFEKRDVQRLVQRFRRLIEGVAADPEQRLSALPILSQEERRELRLQPLPRREHHPLSVSQAESWLEVQNTPKTTAHHHSLAVDLEGPLDAAALRDAVRAVIDAHEVLRSTFRVVGDRAVQRVAARGEVSWLEADLSAPGTAASGTAAPESRLDHWQARASEVVFHPETGPLHRFALARISDTEHRFLAVVHRLVLDAPGLSALLRRILEAYAARLRGDAELTPRPALQVADFAEWQERQIEAHLTAPDRAYWRRQLDGALPGFELPPDRPYPEPRGFAAGRTELPLDPGALARLGVGDASEETTFRRVTALVLLLFHRLSGRRDVTVALPTPVRMAGLEDTLGPLSHLWPLRVRLDPGESFEELARRVDRTVDEMERHGTDSFYEVLTDLQVKRDRNRPMMPVAVARVPAVEVEAGGLSAVSRPPRIDQVLFDLLVSVHPRAGDVRVVFSHYRDLFEPATLARLADSLGALLAAAAARPGVPVAELGILSEAQKRQLLAEITGPAAPDDGPAVHRRFERWAARRPEAVAATCGDREIRYGELDDRAERIAAWLRARGVGREDRVALFGDRSIGMLATILGVWKAGGAYVPLDPGQPDERLRKIVAAVAPKVMATRKSLAGRGGALAEAAAAKPEVFRWDADADLDADARAAAASGAEPEPGQLAYVFYTSGSTGEPKGAMVDHAGMRRHVAAKVELVGLGEDGVLAQNASHCFDVSVWQFTAALTVGGRVAIYPDDVSLDPRETMAAVERDGVTVLETVPTFLAAMLDVPESHPLERLRHLVSNAETLPVELARRWLDRYPDVTLINTFGTTECSDDTLHHVVRAPLPAGALRVPVGESIAGTSHPVLDARLRPVPPGFAGQIAVAGVPVGRGYWNDPRRTAEVFVPDPEPRRPGDRLYLTGDLGRWSHRGSMELIGRQDHQVKVRGHRVELGEVEAALYRHPGVSAAAVVQCEADSWRRPVAYVEARPGTGLTSSELRVHAERELPEYMVPAAFEVVGRMPRTTTGKVDRKELAGRPMPVPELSPEAREAARPRTPTEKLLARIWADVLGLEEVGVHDGFFKLGGDSIMSIRVASLTQREGYELAARDFYKYQTVAELAAALDRRGPSAPRSGERAAAGEVPLTPMQHWFFAKEPLAPHHWNVAWLVRPRERMEPGRVASAMRHTVEHHDAFRLRFHRAGSGNGSEESTGWRAFTTAEPTPEFFHRFDLRQLPEERRREALEAIAARLQKTLDLAAGPLLRVAYFDLGAGTDADGEGESRLLFLFHHLVMDPVSLEIVLEDFLTAYGQLDAGGEVRLRPTTTPVQRWAHLLSEHADSEELRGELAHWLERLPERTEPLPVDHPGGAVTEATAGTVTVALDEEETAALLRRLPALHGTRIDDVLLAALVTALAGWTGERALLVETPSHGREEIIEGVDLSRTVGWFSSGSPLWLDLRDAPTPEEALAAVQEQRAAVPHRGLGYGLLRHLASDAAVRERLAALPRAQVTFQYDSRSARGGGDGVPLEPAEESVGPRQSALADPGSEPVLLWIKAASVDGRLEVRWTYGEEVHRRATVERLARAYLEALRELLGAPATAGAGGGVGSSDGSSEERQEKYAEVNASS